MGRDHLDSVLLPNYWTDLDLKTAFDSPGLELSEYVAKFYLRVTDDVTSRVRFFYYLSPLAGSDGQISRIRLRQSR